MSTASQIVYGGGWKSTHVERLKVKAWIALFLAIGLGSVSILSMDSAWLYLSILAGLSLMVSVVLFFRERPLQFPSFSDVAREDPSTIQGRSGGMYGYDAERDTAPMAAQRRQSRLRTLLLGRHR